MSAAPDRYIGPAFIGWRSWRVMPLEQLGEPSSMRLCASGSRGLPKVWEPRQAMQAVCGKYNTTHSSPWPDCECGFYAYRRRDDAEDHLQTFVKGKNGDRALGWAFGRVSLWGRIVECEDGWRSEYAYPYEITVHCDDPKVAVSLRSLYGIDVQTAPAIALESDPEESEEDIERGGLLGELRDVANELATIRAELVSPSTTTRPATTTRPRTLWSTLSYAADGSWRSDAQEQAFVHSELFEAQRAHDNKPVTAADLAESIMRRAGVDEYEVDRDDASKIGVILARLAMGHKVDRAKTPKKRGVHWTRFMVPDDYTEYDPSERFLEQDVAMVLALGRAGGGGPASAKAMLRELSVALGAPQAAPHWSGTFVRCKQRDWITEVGNRTYNLTAAGSDIVHVGRLPTDWPRADDDLAAPTLLRELQEAVLQAGDSVTVDALARRFIQRQWRWSRPGGHALAQRLRKLQERGLVESERRAASKLLYWCPSTSSRAVAA